MLPCAALSCAVLCWCWCCAPTTNRLTPQALADLCVARSLYSSTLTRIKNQRRLLVLQLAQVVNIAHLQGTVLTYRTDAVFNSETGLFVK